MPLTGRNVSYSLKAENRLMDKLGNSMPPNITYLSKYPRIKFEALVSGLASCPKYLVHVGSMSLMKVKREKIANKSDLN